MNSIRAIRQQVVAAGEMGHLSIQSSSESLKEKTRKDGGSPPPPIHHNQSSVGSLYEDEEPYNFDDFEEDDNKQLFAAPSINTYIFQSESVIRRWLSTHGKKKFIDFTDTEMVKLRKYFQELDEDGSGKNIKRYKLVIGSIGIEELEKPLISLGLCNTREDVKNILSEVDEDDSGQIEFKEFLQIIKKAQYEKSKRAKSLKSFDSVTTSTKKKVT